MLFRKDVEMRKYNISDEARGRILSLGSDEVILFEGAKSRDNSIVDRCSRMMRKAGIKITVKKSAEGMRIIVL